MFPFTVAGPRRIHTDFPFNSAMKETIVSSHGADLVCWIFDVVVVKPFFYLMIIG